MDNSIQNIFIKFFLLLFILSSLSASLLAKDHKMPKHNEKSISVSSGDYFYDSGGNKSRYGNKEDAMEHLTSDPGTIIRVIFEEFKIEHRYNCGYDWLKIFDGIDTSTTEFGTYCGNNSPGTITSTGNSLTFQFHSDRYTTKSGWKARIEVVEALPVLSISDISVNEGDGVAIFQARLNKISTEIVSFSWITANGTARSPNDYIGEGWKHGTIPAGQLFVNLEVTIKDDGIYEGDENFICDITSVSNASILNSRGVCTIIDNDSNASIKINNQDASIGTIPDSLVQNVLVTGCLIAENVDYTGDQTNGIGYFDKGDSDFPLSSGVILSTGNVENAKGPASNSGNDTNSGFNFDASNQDSDLVTLAGTTPRFDWWGNLVGWDKPYYDAQVLEFDFIPAGNKLEFNYIFASEEYRNYACSSYNDGFAFILSGPGIDNDTGLSGQNIALTESGDPVSINNVYKNQCPGYSDNSELYVEEIGGYSIAFDGRTKILTARADVTSCETYHIKLIVYDRNDKSYNSAVFLEARSFKSNEVIVENRIDGIDGDKEIMYRGCDQSYISFTRKEGLDLEYPFHITIGGTAENGVDYYQVTEDGTKIGDFPEDVSFGVGETEVKIFYVASDEVTGSKNILFEVLRGCPCSTAADDYFKKNIEIIDVARIEANAISNVRCDGGDPVSTIIIKLAAELDPIDYLYAIDGGDFQEDNKFQGAYAVGIHTVSIKDKFSCSSEDITIDIAAATDLKANAGVNFDMCEKESTKTLNGTGGIDYLWTCDKSAGLDGMDVTSPTPSISPNLIAGDYTYTLTVSDGLSGLCESSADVVVTVKPTPVINSIDASVLEVCSGQAINLTATISNVSSPSYKWMPDAEIIGSSIGLSATVQPTSTLLASRTFTFKVLSDNSCFASQSISGIKVYPKPSVSLLSTSNLCSDGSNGEIHIDVSGGTPADTEPKYNYLWSHDGGLNSPDATSLGVDNYTITVTDSKLCGDTKIFKVIARPESKGIFFE